MDESWELVYPADRYADLKRLEQRRNLVIRNRGKAGYALQIRRSERADIVAALGEPAAEGEDTRYLAIDREKFYDEQIAPALLDLAEQCAAHGLSLLAFCEYGDGYGHTRHLAPDASNAMRLIDGAGQAKGDFDGLVFAWSRWAKRENLVGTSLVLGVLGRVGNEGR